MNEDYRVDLDIIAQLRKKSGIRCLTVASSGETCLAMCSLPNDMVSTIDACDINPHQIFLTDLRRVVLAQLDNESCRRLNGIWDPKDQEVWEAEKKRCALFEQVKGELQDNSRTFWESREGQRIIKRGLSWCGNWERQLASLRQLLAKDAVTSPLQDPTIVGTAKLKNLVAYGLSAERTSAIFMDGHAEADDEPWWSHIVGYEVAETVEQNLKRFQDTLTQNYFVSHIFGGHFVGPRDDNDDALPLIYTTSGQQIIKEYGCGSDRLRLHCGEFGEVTDRLHDQCDGNRWDFISLGSIPDCMNKDELLSLLQLLYVCCEVHGVLLLRRSCHQDFKIDDVLREAGFEIEVEMSNRVRYVERSPLFRDHVVAIRSEIELRRGPLVDPS
eukprot:CAMPEP_0174294118 /NCGR_PEP_ID=MMETSP0809-20121228/40632_1 /TAXON_ID=73025 ORGANISM="Eutreptiella gymnastica-like, Strain CCMP1594" /NCGR_SAMPLE_ID=MMETSP0809 /ASSEMBLY_ACC=CAM_ASM_000658 /LENGTH=384 /DNA_ID=CAMNT_0015395339 /DNA_START=84 /DNA_END=1238 /DNA_ORIENTATION=+